MKFSAAYTRTATDENGDIEIVFTSKGGDKFIARKAVEYAKQFEKLSISITEYRKGRSLDANAYMWVMLEHLAYVMKTTSVDLYRKYVREVGVWKDYQMSEEVAKPFVHLWTEKGIAWIADRLDTEGNLITIRAFYGSSSYNTKQMSRLIDAIVTDCKEAGIETLSEKELNSLKAAWK